MHARTHAHARTHPPSLTLMRCRNGSAVGGVAAAAAPLKRRRLQTGTIAEPRAATAAAAAATSKRPRAPAPRAAKKGTSCAEPPPTAFDKVEAARDVRRKEHAATNAQSIAIACARAAALRMRCSKCGLSAAKAVWDSLVATGFGKTLAYGAAHRPPGKDFGGKLLELQHFGGARGVGFVARVDIDAGVPVGVFEEDFTCPTLLFHTHPCAAVLNADTLVVPCSCSPAAYFNCARAGADAALQLVKNAVTAKMELVTARRVAAGEELTWHYSGSGRAGVPDFDCGRLHALVALCAGGRGGGRVSALLV